MTLAATLVGSGAAAAAADDAVGVAHHARLKPRRTLTTLGARMPGVETITILITDLVGSTGLESGVG